MHGGVFRVFSLSFRVSVENCLVCVSLGYFPRDPFFGRRGVGLPPPTRSDLQPVSTEEPAWGVEQGQLLNRHRQLGWNF